MKYSIKYKMISTVLAFGILGGCGTYVPELQEFYETPLDGQNMVLAIVEQVQCEVQNAVRSTILEDMEQAIAPEVVKVEKDTGKRRGRRLVWLDTWGAQVTLTLTIDEKSALNPGVAFNTPILPAVTSFPGKVTVSTPQSYSLGLGGTFSADATRKETLSLFIDFKKFTGALAKQFVAGSLNEAKIQYLERAAAAPCPHENGIFIESDLKLKEWLKDVTFPPYVQGGVFPDYAYALAAEAKAGKKDVISHEVTFVIVYGGNITPTWKLVRVSANTGSLPLSGSLPLFGATRTKTQDLVITMGPPQEGGGLSISAQNTILASQIGQAVASAIKSTQ